MVNLITFWALLEISLNGLFSWFGWVVWFIVGTVFYFRRTKSLKDIALGILFLFWAALVCFTYKPSLELSGLDYGKLKISYQLLVLWVSFLYFLLLVYFKKDYSYKKINWLDFRSFYGLSVFFISSIFLFSGKLYYWWLNSLITFLFLIFWFFIFAKKNYTRIQKIIISLLFLEFFLALQFFSFIPEVKALIFSLAALFFL